MAEDFVPIGSAPGTPPLWRATCRWGRCALQRVAKTRAAAVAKLRKLVEGKLGLGWPFGEEVHHEGHEEHEGVAVDERG